MSHLRLVHPRRPLLTREQLAHFATPKTWEEILAIEPRMSSARWRAGVIDADELGFGLLTFVHGPPDADDKRRSRRRGVWMLTEKGRAYVARKREVRA